MSAAFSKPDGNAAPLRRRWVVPRRPALPIAAALAIGVCWGQLGEVPVWVWLGICTAAAVLAWVGFRRGWRLTNVIALIALWVGLGGALGQRAAQPAAEQDIVHFTSEAPRVVRLRGVIDDSIVIRDAPHGPQIPAWMEIDHSQCPLRCEELWFTDGWRDVSGQVLLNVQGHLADVRVGDRVEVIGQLSAPRPPDNPGGFDFAQHLKRQGLGGVLRVNHPLAVARLGSASGVRPWIARRRDEARRWCLQRMSQHLSPAAGTIASAMILGERSQLTEDLRGHFQRSGMMHLLALSGLHVGLYLGMLLWVCRLLHLSSRRTAVLLLFALAGYLWITDHRPPVLRAGLLASLAIVCALRGRSVDGLNALAVAAVGLLLWRPLDLFDVGAQLSFLAVAAICWVSHMTTEWAPHLDGVDSSPLRRRLTRWGRRIWQALAVSIAIWLVTAPLTMSTFRLLAPVGMLLNLALIPWTALTLACGATFMLGAVLAPWLAGWLAAPFEATVQVLLQSVKAASELPGAHWRCASPAGWWLIGFYLLLALLWGRVGGASKQTFWRRGFWAWTACGVAVAGFEIPSRTLELRCTCLSVGHGLASVIELPGGEVIVYDVGVIGDGARAARAVADYLDRRGRRRIDALIISHADHDHYSGAFGLLEQFSIDQLLISPTFVRTPASGPMRLCEAASAAGVDIRFVHAGDQVIISRPPSPDLALTVLLPTAGVQSQDDNANSIVLSVEYAGRRILLTGDLEKDGMQRLLRMPARKVDLMFSPHHGGVASNIPELYQWAQPSAVFVSAARGELQQRLIDAAAPGRVLSTAQSGALWCSITPGGDLNIQSHLP